MCKLKPGPPSDVCGPVNATAVVSVTSADDKTMAIQNAVFNGVAVPVAGGRATLPGLPAGDNALDLVVTSGHTGDEVVLTENCDDGTTRTLSTKFIGGGNDPHVGYGVHGQ